MMGGERYRPRPLWELTAARFREFWREPAALFWVYGFPILMILSLGIAFRDQAPGGMAVDVLRGEGAEAVVLMLKEDLRFEVGVCDEEEGRERLRTGRSDLLVVPDGDAGTGYEYRYDPTKPAIELVRNAVDDVLQRAAGRKDLFVARDMEVTELGGRYIDFLVPGLVGMGLLGGGMWGVGFSLVDLRIRKLLKRFAATPMKRSDFLLSLMFSRLVFTIPEVVIVLLFSYYVFGVVVHGSCLAVMVLITAGALQFAGLGLLVASRAQKLETASGLMNAIMMPMWICSGIFFSTDRFPDAMQPFIGMLPLTTLNNALREVINDGASLASVGGELSVMSAWAVVTFLLALKLFRWK